MERTVSSDGGGRPAWRSGLSWPPDQGAAEGHCQFRLSARKEPPPEDRDLQHQRRHPPPAQPARVAGKEARRRLPAGAERAQDDFPAQRAAGGRLPRHLARPARLERRRHPRRGTEPVETRRALPGDPDDKQSRYIEAAVNGVLIGCLYLPNGNPQPGPKFDYKLAWFERLIAPCQRLARGRRARGAGRRLQRRAAPMRHLPDPVVGQGRPAPAGEPGCFRKLLDAGLDRRHPDAAPGRTDLHLLGLQARSLAPQRRAAHRSSAAHAWAGGSAGRCRRRSRGARPGGRQRSRAHVGDSQRWNEAGGGERNRDCRIPSVRASSRATVVCVQTALPFGSARPARSSAVPAPHAGDTHTRRRSASSPSDNIFRRLYRHALKAHDSCVLGATAFTARSGTIARFLSPIAVSL